jgi:YgiT-type zinc finger domain-containing protein
MSGIKKCPKCSGEMVSGEVAREVRILKEGDMVGDKVDAFFCRNCGFIEFYKEPWRLPRQQQSPTEELEESSEKPPPTSEQKRRLVR